MASWLPISLPHSKSQASPIIHTVRLTSRSILHYPWHLLSRMHPLILLRDRQYRATLTIIAVPHPYISLHRMSMLHQACIKTWRTCTIATSWLLAFKTPTCTQSHLIMQVTRPSRRRRSFPTNIPTMLPRTFSPRNRHRSRNNEARSWLEWVCMMDPAARSC